MDQNFISAFYTWFEAQRENIRFQVCKVKIERPISSYPKQLIFAIIEKEEELTQITVWDTGECDIETVSRSLREQISMKSVNFLTAEDMKLTLESILSEKGCF